MALNVPPVKASSSTVADWVEVATLSSARGTYALSRLKRFWDTHRETESTDPEGRSRREEDTDEEGVSGSDEDIFLDSITDELAERSRVLDGCYPFAIAHTGYRLTLISPLNAGQSIYLFCLLLTNCSKGDVLNGTWVPAIDHQVRDLFQACSTVAASAEVNGCAISFGWPRPNDNMPFLQKLHEVYSIFGEGRPVTTPRPGAAIMVKDEEIDIIAWRPRLDRAPGTIYLLGQVASGHNWEDKSIKGGIDYFHRTWFDQAPASNPIASIFIPHAVPPANGGSRKDRMNLLVAKFGTILDRLRIPALTVRGITLATENNGWVVERVGDIASIGTWVTDQIAALRTASPDNL
jgi:hypothetical protein